MTKFRGNRKDNGEEVHGSLIRQVNGKAYIFPPAASLHKIGSGYERVANPVYEVIPESVAQYTTINDKKDVEIYGSVRINGKMSKGGDRIKQKLENGLTRTGIVDFHEGSFRVLGDDGTYSYIHDLLRFIPEYGIEVIGRQYDEKES